MRMNTKNIKKEMINLTISYIDKKLNNQIKDFVYKEKETWNKKLKYVEAKTSGYNPKYSFFETLENNICNDLFRITNKKWKMDCHWINFYEKGDYTKLHHHYENMISSSLIVKGSKDNPLVFRDVNNKLIPILERDGMLVLFDSQTPHSVMKCMEERITLAMDFKQI